MVAAIIAVAIFRGDPIPTTLQFALEQADAGRSIQREQDPGRASDPQRRAGVTRRNNDTIDLAVLGGLKSDQAVKGYKLAIKITKGAPQVIL